MILSISAFWLIPCFSLGTCLGALIMALIHMNVISKMEVSEQDWEQAELQNKYTNLNKPLKEKELGYETN
jgi:hypothetical protein